MGASTSDNKSNQYSDNSQQQSEYEYQSPQRRKFIPTVHDEPDPDYAIQVFKRPQLTFEASKAMQTLQRKGGFCYVPLHYIHQKRAYYQGFWKSGLPHGKGNILLDGGFYFQGQFNMGEAQCQEGLLIYPNGAIYRGGIKNSLLNGYGILTTLNGDMSYQGEWKDGKPHGKGEQTFENGSFYSGQFVEGTKDGKGKYHSVEDNIEYQGDFRKGMMTGSGTLINTQDNIVYVGQVLHGKKNGRGKQTYSYGTYQGQFKNDQFHGNGTFTWNDGRVYNGEFLNGTLHGRGSMKFPTGEEVNGQWINGHNEKITELTKKHKRTIT